MYGAVSYRTSDTDEEAAEIARLLRWFEDRDLDAEHSGGGEGLVYRYHTPTRELRYIWRNYFGAWSTPVAIADYEPWYNRPAIEYLGGGAYGVAYLRQTDSAAYFDRTDWLPGVAERRRLLVEENVLSVTPNPLSGRGRLNYTLNRPACLRAQVFDRAGRAVRTLLDGHSPAGRQSFEFDAVGCTGHPLHPGRCRRQGHYRTRDGCEEGPQASALRGRPLFFPPLFAASVRVTPRFPGRVNECA